MNTPRTALEEWSELSENCTQGRFVARADGLIIADCDDHSYEVGVTPGWNRHDRELVVSAINLLRTHGKALSEALGGWLPIADAPKQRKVLVGYHNKLGNWRTVVATYYGPGTLELADEADDTDDGYAAPGWYENTETHDWIKPTDEPPTHWRPLPPPPTSAKEVETENG